MSPSSDLLALGQLELLLINLNNCTTANDSVKNYITECYVAIVLLKDANCNKEELSGGTSFPKD